MQSIPPPAKGCYQLHYVLKNNCFKSFTVYIIFCFKTASRTYIVYLSFDFSAQNVLIIKFKENNLPKHLPYF